MPRSACSAGTPAAAQPGCWVGCRAAAAVPTISSISPSGSRKAITLSLSLPETRRWAGPSKAIAWRIRRSSQKPVAAAGAANDVTAACPAPARPRRAPGQGKNVSRLPGDPFSSPK